MTAPELMTWGSATHCATCDRHAHCVAIASDPEAPASGRWFVCEPCQRAGRKLGARLVYEDLTEAGAA